MKTFEIAGEDYGYKSKSMPTTPDNKREECAFYCGRPWDEEGDENGFEDCSSAYHKKSPTDPFLSRTLAEFDVMIGQHIIGQGFEMNKDEIKKRKEFYKFFNNILIDKNCLNPDNVKMQQAATYWLSKLDAYESSLLERIEEKATDKAEILKNKGYGNVPILFEKEEITNLIKEGRE